MGKHDQFAHNFHVSKQMKFKQMKPHNQLTAGQAMPQVPRQGTHAQNMFK